MLRCQPSVSSISVSLYNVLSMLQTNKEMEKRKHEKIISEIFRMALSLKNCLWGN